MEHFKMIWGEYFNIIFLFRQILLYLNVFTLNTYIVHNWFILLKKLWTWISVLDNTAVILTNRMGFSLKEEPVLSMIILISDNGIPSLTSTNTLTIQVCDCGESASTEMCTKKGLLLIMEFKTEVIIAILVCIMVIFGK